MDLAHRLGIEEGYALAVVNEPPQFWDILRPLPREVEVLTRASRPLDVLVYFSDTLSNIERRVPSFAGMLATPGSLWVGHPPDKVATQYVDRTGARAGLATAEMIGIGGGWFLRRLAKR